MRLIKNHPLPDGNKRAGYLSMIEFAERNGLEWRDPSGDDPDGNETVSIIEGVAAGEVGEGELAGWVKERLSPPDRAS
ncbi:MAG: hypothetical protein WD276_01935 [Actinomycetota bacterium]